MAETAAVPWAERLIKPDTCISDAESVARQMKSYGGESRLIPCRETVRVADILQQSLLGLGQRIDTSVLNPRELYFYQRFHKEKIIPKNKLLSDLDGVFVSPAHNWGGSGYLDEDVLKDFASLCQMADSVVVRTSRFYMPDEVLERLGRLRFLLDRVRVGNIGRFPFVESHGLTTIQRSSENKIDFRCGKSLFGSSEELYGLLTENNPDFCYVVGSSRKDRREMLRLYKDHPEMGGKVVYFDTCHWYL